MAIENVVFARGHECHRPRLPFHRAIDHRRSIGVFGEEIVPGLENDGVHQHNLAGDVSGLFEIGFLPSPTSTTGTRFTEASAGAHAIETARTRKRREHGAAAHFRCAHLIRGRRSHLGRAFRPGIRNGESFGVNAVGAGGGERLHSPLDGVLHGGVPGTRPPISSVKAVEIVFQRRGLECDLNDLVGVIGVGGSCCEPGEGKNEGQEQGLHSSHVGCN